MSIAAAAPLLMPVWQQTPSGGGYTVARIGSMSSEADINAYQYQSRMQTYSDLGMEYLPDFSAGGEGFAVRDSGVDVLREARSRQWNSLTAEQRFQRMLESSETLRAKSLQKASSSQSQSSESVGIRGAVPVPAASSYTDASGNFNELVSNEGQLAQVAKASNIELCGFLDGLPKLGIDLSAPQLGIPALQDFMAKVNGVGEKVLGFLTGTYNPFNPLGRPSPFDVLQQGLQRISNLATAIQQSIPTITCGGGNVLGPVAASPIGTALFPVQMSLPPVSVVQQIGIPPSINVSSPNVTVQSLNDVLDAGEI